MFRVVIAHQTDLVLIGAKAVLAELPRYRVLAAVNSLSLFIPAVRQHQPEVMVVHSELDPDTDLLKLVQLALEAAPQSRLILLGNLKDGLLVRDLFECGAWGYLYESDDLQECLPLAIDTVMRQRPYLSPTANSEYLVAMRSPQRDWHLDDEARAVLRMLAQGHHVGYIAYHMKLQPRRVYWIREKLRNRFGAQTNEHLMSRAAAEGYVFP